MHLPYYLMTNSQYEQNFGKRLRSFMGPNDENHNHPMTSDNSRTCHVTETHGRKNDIFRIQIVRLSFRCFRLMTKVNYQTEVLVPFLGYFL